MHYFSIPYAKSHIDYWMYRLCSNAVFSFYTFLESKFCRLVPSRKEFFEKLVIFKFYKKKCVIVEKIIL